MTETITSKFKIVFWFQMAALFTAGLGFIGYCFKRSIRDGEINIYSGELLVGIVATVIVLWVLNNLLRSDIRIITLTPQYMIIDYPVTKKHEIIEYQEISGLSKSYVSASRTLSITYKGSEELRVEINGNRTIFITKDMYKNYSELKDALYSITKHPRD